MKKKSDTVSLVFLTDFLHINAFIDEFLNLFIQFHICFACYFHIRLKRITKFLILLCIYDQFCIFSIFFCLTAKIFSRSLYSSACLFFLLFCPFCFLIPDKNADQNRFPFQHAGASERTLFPNFFRHFPRFPRLLRHRFLLPLLFGRHPLRQRRRLRYCSSLYKWKLPPRVPFHS